MLRKSDGTLDPVECLNGEWGYWDETWTTFVGPYDSEEQARQKLWEYADYLENGLQ